MLGYLPLAKADAELLFQILSQRHEKYPVIITTNLPFSEWTSVFTDHRLCKALIDRITHHAHIIETGNNSARLEQTLTCLNKIKKQRR
jgi:DNA replication protein DnaC